MQVCSRFRPWRRLLVLVLFRLTQKAHLIHLFYVIGPVTSLCQQLGKSKKLKGKQTSTALATEDILMVFRDLNIPFEIEKASRDAKGAKIIRQCRSIASWSNTKKMSGCVDDATTYSYRILLQRVEAKKICLVAQIIQVNHCELISRL